MIKAIYSQYDIRSSHSLYMDVDRESGATA